MIYAFDALGRVALCFHECFKVYHTFKDFTKSLNTAQDSTDESDS